MDIHTPFERACVCVVMLSQLRKLPLIPDQQHCQAFQSKPLQCSSAGYSTFFQQLPNQAFECTPTSKLFHAPARISPKLQILLTSVSTTVLCPSAACVELVSLGKARVFKHAHKRVPTKIVVTYDPPANRHRAGSFKSGCLQG